MFGGFDPNEQQHEFFQRRRGLSFVLAILVYAGLFFVMTNVELSKPTEEEEEEFPVELAPQPEEEEPEEELEVEEEEPEPEPEPEPEEPPPPAPGPPPRPDQPISDEPPPEIETPTDLDAESVDESASAKEGQNSGNYAGGGAGEPGGTSTEDAEDTEPEKPAEEVKKAPPPRDPKQPQKRRRDDKPAKADPANPLPEYPPQLKKRGIGGKVTVSLTITPTSDGGAKLSKIAIKKVQLSNCPADVEEKAKAALKQSISKALANWKYLSPCKMADGRPFVCVETKSFPFVLK